MIQSIKNHALDFLKFVLHHPRSTVLFCVVLTAGALVAVRHLEFDRSLDVFFDQQTETYIRSKEFEKQFGGGELTIIALSAADIFTERNLQLIARLTEQCRDLRNVRKVTSLTTVNDIVGEQDSFIVAPLVKSIPADPARLAEIKRRALDNPLFCKNVISVDGRTAGIAVEIRDVPAAKGAHRQAIVMAIEAMLKKDVPPDVTAHVTGGAAIEYHYNQYLHEDMSRFVPLSLLLMALILWATFRRLRLMIYPMVIVMLGLLYTMALMPLLGYKINSVTSIVPPCILAMTVAESIHYVMHVARGRGADRLRLLEEKLGELLVPFFLTSVTTVAGFLSLLTTRSPAIRQLGVVAGAGVTMTIVLTLTLLPVMMRRGRFSADESAGVDAQERQLDLWVAPIVEWIIRVVDRHRAAVLWGTLVVCLVGAGGIFRIKSESSLLAQMGEYASITKSTRFVEKRLSGVNLAYISLRHASADGFKEPDSLRLMEKIQGFLATIPEIDKTLSLPDFFKDMNRSFHGEDPAFYRIPDTRALAAQYALLYGADDLDDYVDASWSWANIAIRMTEHRSSRQLAIFERIRTCLERNSRPGIRMELVGPAVWSAEGANTVTMGQTRSLSSGMLVIFAMMFVCFRSLGVGLISTIPNLIPLIVNFGLMGFFGIKLDTATSLISAVAIGIIVDNTVHFIYGFGEAMEQNHGDYAAAVYYSLRTRGAAMVSTAVVLALTFGILMTSHFVPVFQFGLLSGVLMITALFADLVVNPCLLVWLKPKVRKMV